MTTYLSLKLVHVISATLLLGTGLGTAFFLWNAVRSGDRGVELSRQENHAEAANLST